MLTIPLWQHQYIIGYKMINHQFYDDEKHILKVLIHDSDSINIESKGIKYIWDAAEFPMDIRDYNWGYFNFLLLQKGTYSNSDLNTFGCELFCTWSPYLISSEEKFYKLWEEKLQDIKGLQMKIPQLIVAKLAHLNCEKKKFYKSKKVFV